MMSIPNDNIDNDEIDNNFKSPIINKKIEKLEIKESTNERLNKWREEQRLNKLKEEENKLNKLKEFLKVDNKSDLLDNNNADKLIETPDSSINNANRILSVKERKELVKQDQLKSTEKHLLKPRRTIIDRSINDTNNYSTTTSYNNTPDIKNDKSTGKIDKNLWNKALNDLKSNEQSKFLLTKEQTISQYHLTKDSGNVRRRINEWEELFMSLMASKDQIAKTMKAALLKYKLLHTDLSNKGRKSNDSPNQSQEFDKPEEFIIGNTCIYNMSNYLSHDFYISHPIFENIRHNKTEISLPVGIYNDMRDNSNPPNIQAIALLFSSDSDNDVYLAITMIPKSIDSSSHNDSINSAHDSDGTIPSSPDLNNIDPNIFGLKKLAVFLPKEIDKETDQNYNESIFERLYNILPNVEKDNLSNSPFNNSYTDYDIHPINLNEHLSSPNSEIYDYDNTSIFKQKEYDEINQDRSNNLTDGLNNNTTYDDIDNVISEIMDQLIKTIDIEANISYYVKSSDNVFDSYDNQSDVIYNNSDKIDSENEFNSNSNINKTLDFNQVVEIGNDSGNESDDNDSGNESDDNSHSYLDNNHNHLNDKISTIQVREFNETTMDLIDDLNKHGYTKSTINETLIQSSSNFSNDNEIVDINHDYTHNDLSLHDSKPDAQLDLTSINSKEEKVNITNDVNIVEIDVSTTDTLMNDYSEEIKEINYDDDNSDKGDDLVDNHIKYFFDKSIYKTDSQIKHKDDNDDEEYNEDDDEFSNETDGNDDPNAVFSMSHHISIAEVSNPNISYPNNESKNLKDESSIEFPNNKNLESDQPWEEYDERLDNLPEITQVELSFDLLDVKSVSSSSNCLIVSIVSDGLCKSIFFTGTLKYQILEDTMAIVNNNEIIQWARGVAMSGKLIKWPTFSQSTGRASKRFFTLRGKTLSYYKYSKSDKSKIDIDYNSPLYTLELTHDTTIQAGRHRFQRSISIYHPLDTIWIKRRKPKHLPTEEKWINDIERAIRNLNKKPVFRNKLTIDNTWFHESTQFTCISVDIYNKKSFYNYISLYKYNVVDKNNIITPIKGKSTVISDPIKPIKDITVDNKLTTRVTNFLKSFRSNQPIRNESINTTESTTVINIPTTYKVIDTSYSADIGCSNGKKLQVQLLNALNNSTVLNSDLFVIKLIDNRVIVGGSNGYIAIGSIDNLNIQLHQVTLPDGITISTNPLAKYVDIKFHLKSATITTIASSNNTESIIDTTRNELVIIGDSQGFLSLYQYKYNKSNSHNNEIEKLGLYFQSFVNIADLGGSKRFEQIRTIKFISLDQLLIGTSERLVLVYITLNSSSVYQFSKWTDFDRIPIGFQALFNVSIDRYIDNKPEIIIWKLFHDYLDNEDISILQGKSPKCKISRYLWTDDMNEVAISRLTDIYMNLNDKNSVIESED